MKACGRSGHRAGWLGENRLVSELVFLVRLAMEIRGNRNAAEALEVRLAVEFHNP